VHDASRPQGYKKVEISMPSALEALKTIPADLPLLHTIIAADIIIFIDLMFATLQGGGAVNEQDC
jgi:hypothetical protein